MKKALKVLILVTVVSLIMFSFISLAYTAPDVETAAPNGLGSTIDKLTNSASGLIFSIGTAIALIVIVTFGVQWIVATPAKKAELKGKMWNIVIGVAILFTATLILSTLGTFFENINNSNGNNGSNNSNSGNNGQVDQI